MKKAYICTLYGNENFGNKLQNYALQTKLEELGFNVKTIKTEEVKNKCFRNIKNIIKFFLPQYHGIVARYNLFLKFNKKYLKYINKKDGADYYVIGSDQVWNPNASRFFRLFLGYDLEGNKISYAASFGISNIPEEKKELVAKGLADFKAISVREENGKKILEDLIKVKNINTLIDPTMLLSSEQWNKISKKPKKFVNKKYILCYFLGDLSSDRNRAIQQFAQDNDCEIINILDKNDQYFVSGPAEFLYLEKNAYLVCTDSFHSCVFAILFNKPFVVFERKQNNIENMNSRIDTLLKKFELDNRTFNGKEITQENMKVNYKKTIRILEDERKKADFYLRKSLDVDLIK